MNYGIVKRHTKMSIFAFNSLTLYWRQSLSYSYLIKKIREVITSNFMLSCISNCNGHIIVKKNLYKNGHYCIQFPYIK